MTGEAEKKEQREACTLLLVITILTVLLSIIVGITTDWQEVAVNMAEQYRGRQR